MPDMDMDETINSDRPFEETVKALLDVGKVEETEPDGIEPELDG